MPVTAARSQACGEGINFMKSGLSWSGLSRLVLIIHQFRACTICARTNLPQNSINAQSLQRQC